MANPYLERLEDLRDPDREYRATFRFLVLLAAIALIFYILFTQIFIGVRVVGASMQPTLHDGDYLFVDTTAPIERGDIVVLSAQVHGQAADEDGYSWIIKRVVGLPGDSIYAEGGTLYRMEAGGTEYAAVDEPYLGEEWVRYAFIAPVTVGEGEIYVMGDNRNNSQDSRELGPQPVEHVVGVVTSWSLAAKDILSDIFGLFARDTA